MEPWHLHYCRVCLPWAPARALFWVRPLYGPLFPFLACNDYAGAMRSCLCKVWRGTETAFLTPRRPSKGLTFDTVRTFHLQSLKANHVHEQPGLSLRPGENTSLSCMSRGGSSLLVAVYRFPRIGYSKQGVWCEPTGVGTDCKSCQDAGLVTGHAPEHSHVPRLPLVAVLRSDIHGDFLMPFLLVQYTMAHSLMSKTPHLHHTATDDWACSCIVPLLRLRGQI